MASWLLLLLLLLLLLFWEKRMKRRSHLAGPGLSRKQDCAATTSSTVAKALWPPRSVPQSVSFWLCVCVCAVWHCCHLIRLSNFVHRWTRCQNLQRAWFKSPDFLQLSTATTTTTTRNSKRIRPYKLPKLLIPIRLPRSRYSSSTRSALLSLSQHQPRRRSTRSSPTSISNRSHTDFRIILWTSAYIMPLCVCVCVCAQAGGCRKSVHKMADAHDISSSYHVAHAPPPTPVWRPSRTASPRFGIVCFECRLVALQLEVASRPASIWRITWHLSMEHALATFMLKFSLFLF